MPEQNSLPAILSQEVISQLSPEAINILMLMTETQLAFQQGSYEGAITKLNQAHNLLLQLQQPAGNIVDISAGYERTVLPLKKAQKTIATSPFQALTQCLLLMAHDNLKKELVMPTVYKAYQAFQLEIRKNISASPDSFETQTTQEASSPPVAEEAQSKPENFSPPTVSQINTSSEDKKNQQTISTDTHNSALAAQTQQLHPAYNQAYKATKLMYDYIKEGQYDKAISCLASINKIVNQRNTGEYYFEYSAHEYQERAKAFLFKGELADSILNGIYFLLSAPASDSSNNRIFYQQIIDACINDLEMQKEEEQVSEHFFNNIYRLHEIQPEACLVEALAWRERHGLDFKQAMINGNQQKQSFHRGHIEMAENLIEQLQQQIVQPHKHRMAMASTKKCITECDEEIRQLNNKIHMLPDNSDIQEFYKETKTIIKNIRDTKKAEYATEKASGLKHAPKENSSEKEKPKTKNKVSENFAKNQHGFYNKPSCKPASHISTKRFGRN